MSGGGAAMNDSKARNSRLIVGMCVACATAMLAMAYAAVPLYRMFCQITGYGGTTQRVTQYSNHVLERRITIRFDANTAGIAWDFQPAVREKTIRIGETAEAGYTAKNLSAMPVAGRASYNVTPELAGAYFSKIECFCFTDTKLKPGETIDMPVVFYVDPAIANVPELKNLKTITLSYTFFPIEGTRPEAALPETTGSKTTFNRQSGG